MDFLEQPRWLTASGTAIDIATPGPEGAILMGAGEEKTPVWSKVINAQNAQFFGTCSTSASTSAKTVTIDGFTSENLINGTRIAVYFTYNNTSSSPTLNVSNTGALNLVTQTGTELTGAVGDWAAGSVVSFVYYNNEWVLQSPTLIATLNGTEYFAGNTEPTWYAPTSAGTSGYLLTANGSNNAPTWDPYYWNFFTGTCSSSSTATTKTVTLSNNDGVFSLREGVIVSVKFTYSNSTSSTASRYLAVNGTSSCLIKDKYGNNFNGTVYTWNSGDTVLFQYRGGYWYTVTGITGNLISGTTTTENATYGNSIGDKIVTAWGRESSQFGRFTISRSNTSGDIVDVSGEEGYWKNQKLTGTAFIPNGEQVRIYQEKMDNITYWIKYLSY